MEQTCPHLASECVLTGFVVLDSSARNGGQTGIIQFQLHKKETNIKTRGEFGQHITLFCATSYNVLIFPDVFRTNFIFNICLRTPEEVKTTLQVSDR